MATSMATKSDNASLNKLNSILLDAMNQSRALFSKLEDSTRTIDRLKRENEQLQQELTAFRAASRGAQGQEDVSAQLDYLFQQDVEKQAEIECLKRRLRAARKDRPKHHLKDSQLASPAPSSDGVECVPSSHPRPTTKPVAHETDSTTAKHALDEGMGSAACLPRKRLHPEPPDEALQVHSTNVLNGKERRLEWKGRDRANGRAEALPIAKEDGEDHGRKENEELLLELLSEKKQSGVHRRLDALLSAASPANSALSKSQHRSTKFTNPRNPAGQPPALLKSASDVATSANNDRPSGMRFLRPSRHREPAPEDEEPLRSRPLIKLNLSDFKLNPAFQDGYTFAFSETVRNKEQRKCLPGCIRRECCGNQMRALALTLGLDLKVSDDDLLLDFLGPGSEKKILTLTSVARENLLHEARVRRVANDYGKMHRNVHERATSPSGFWSTDMPDLQEASKEREEARQWVRDEVERRYREACRQDGKWIFADK